MIWFKLSVWVQTYLHLNIDQKLSECSICVFHSHQHAFTYKPLKTSRQWTNVSCKHPAGSPPQSTGWHTVISDPTKPCPQFKKCSIHDILCLLTHPISQPSADKLKSTKYLSSYSYLSSCLVSIYLIPPNPVSSSRSAPLVTACAYLHTA